MVTDEVEGTLHPLHPLCFRLKGRYVKLCFTERKNFHDLEALNSKLSVKIADSFFICDLTILWITLLVFVSPSLDACDLIAVLSGLSINQILINGYPAS